MTAVVDVVIPTYNNVDELRACLAALELQVERRFRVLVCVDGSTDPTMAYLQKLKPGYPMAILEHPDRMNHGRSAARNLALPAVEAGYLLMLDSDMRLEPAGIAEHLSLLSRRDSISVGDVVYLNAAENTWARYQATRGKNKSKGGQRIGPLAFNTQNVALRTSDFVDLGGFDETLVGYGGEDTELGIRLAGLGRTFVFNDRARAKTIERKTVQEGLAQLRQYGRTNLRSIRRKHPTSTSPFWIDRFESNRLQDRALRALLNPITDRVVDLGMLVSPFAVQRQLLNYKVIRNVFSGYREGPG
jgi:GT2 family glycosyltransferase